MHVGSYDHIVCMVTFTKHCLLGKLFVWRTGHNPIQWLHKLTRQLTRRVEQLANFQYEIVYGLDKLLADADELSGLPSAIGKNNIFKIKHAE